MNSFIIFCLLFGFISSVTSVYENENEEEVKIESLCEQPIINSADRLVNNTVRLYRDRHYWELKGVETGSTSVDGPFEVPFENMAPILRNHSVVTLLGGTDRGKTAKIVGKIYWLWDERGNMKTVKEGLRHNRFPTYGFNAAIHDGNADDPTLIGFEAIHVFYFSTRYNLWTIDKTTGYIGGKYNESFPSDVSAAFSYPANDPKDGYIVYFFKRDEFCKRTKGKGCQEWISNKVLFGCDKQKSALLNDRTESGKDGQGVAQGSGLNNTGENPTTQSGAVQTSVHSFTAIIVCFLVSIHILINI